MSEIGAMPNVSDSLFGLEPTPILLIPCGLGIFFFFGTAKIQNLAKSPLFTILHQPHLIRSSNFQRYTS